MRPLFSKTPKEETVKTDEVRTDEAQAENTRAGSIQIRPIDMSDPDVQRQVGLIIEKTEKQYWLEQDDDDIATMDDADSSAIYGLLNDGEIVGVCGMFFKGPRFEEMNKLIGIDPDKSCELGLLTIEREYRGRGYANRLTARLVEAAKSRGAKEVFCCLVSGDRVSASILSRIGLSKKKDIVIGGRYVEVYSAFL